MRPKNGGCDHLKSWVPSLTLSFTNKPSNLSWCQFSYLEYGTETLGFLWLLKQSNVCKFPRWLSGKESACQTGDIRDTALILGSGRSPGEGNGNLLQYSCLENPMDRAASWATVPGATRSQTRLNNWAQCCPRFKCLTKVIQKYIYVLYVLIHNIYMLICWISNS